MNKYSHYFALEKQLRQSGYHIHRREIISEHTHDRTDSLRQLTTIEYAKLIAKMQHLAAPTQATHKNKMRRKLIALFRKMGYETPDKKANMKAIYTWVKKYGLHHKALKDHSKAELATLISQTEIMYQSHIKEIHR